MFKNHLDEIVEEKGADLCEWCGEREADKEKFAPGSGVLDLCGECALLLLSSIDDN